MPARGRVANIAVDGTHSKEQTLIIRGQLHQVGRVTSRRKEITVWREWHLREKAVSHRRRKVLLLRSWLLQYLYHYVARYLTVHRAFCAVSSQLITLIISLAI